MDVTRYRNVAVVFLCIALAMVALDRALYFAFGSAPRWLVPEQKPIGWDIVDCTEKRFAALFEEYEWEAADLGEPLCVYFGLSTARLGIDPDVLAARTGHRMRFVGFHGNGGSIEHLMGMARPLLRSDFRPALAILALHPCWLAGQRSDGLQLEVPPAVNWKTRLTNKVRGLAHETWITSHRTFVNHFVRSGLYSLRETLFVDLDLPPNAFSAPDPDPWKPPKYFTGRRDPEYFLTQLDRWKTIGWFDSESYTNPNNQNPQVLLDLIAKCHDRGTEVVIVQMPECSQFRALIPPEAEELLRKTLQRSAGGSNVVVWDLHDSIDDEYFHDTIHLGQEGRGKFSQRLSELVNSLPQPAAHH
ncbi:MAG TPA: hypothetical protein VHD36_15000 [Pirellulales bacterium]|nr:hypothetical protein [Pirellulales bacterium]